MASFPRSFPDNSYKPLVSNQTGRLTLNKNRLKQKQEIGLNIRGNFLPPESDACQAAFKSIEVLHNIIHRNLQLQRKEFQLGPIPKKTLILGFPYVNLSKQVQLHVVDISLNDKIELAWKQQLNRIYMKDYLKQAKSWYNWTEVVSLKIKDFISAKSSDVVFKILNFKFLPNNHP